MYFKITSLIVEWPFCWTYALIFNAMALILPIMGAQTLYQIYGKSYGMFPPSVNALASSRVAISDAFTAYAEQNGRSRAAWIKQIETELKAKDITAAQGFMLAGPAFLAKKDRDAILAAADATPTGNEDERLLKAALLFLSDDARAMYQRLASDREGMPIWQTTIAYNPVYSEFYVLGDYGELSNQARDLVAGQDIDVSLFLLSCIGMVLSDYNRDTQAALRIKKAASILKASWQTNRLRPNMTQYLASQLRKAIDLQKLVQTLDAAFQKEHDFSKHDDLVISALKSSQLQDGLSSIFDKLEQIYTISANTSTSASVLTLLHVDSAADLNRARLLTQAGGRRIIALIKLMGRDALFSASQPIKWDISRLIYLIGGVGFAIAMLWVTLSMVKTMLKQTRLVSDFGEAM